MITSFEVGSVFQIVDKATPVISRLSKEVAEFSKLVAKTKKDLASLGTASFSGLNKNLKAATDQVTALQVAIDRASGQIVGSTATATAGVQQLTAQWRAAAAAARAAGTAARTASGVPSIRYGGGGLGAGGVGGGGLPALPGGGGGRRGNVPGRTRVPNGTWGTGTYVHSPTMELPGGAGFGMRGHGGAGMAAAGLAGYALWDKAQLEDAVFQMIWHAGVADNAENQKKFGGIIQSTASQTGFSYKDVADAATNQIRLMKGAPGGGIDILPEMLKAAATEARLKGIGLKESMTSYVELAHMTKEYSPEEIKKLAPLFGFLSTANPATLPQMVRAASYAMPTLQSALHMDPADVLYETTAIARAGATNTKSGTWVRAAFERSLPPDASITGDKEYARRMFAMRKLGLVDESGKSTVLDPTGDHLDIDKLLNTVRTNADKLSLGERNAFVKKVFGEQGSRGIDLMMQPQVLAQNQELKRLLPEFKERYGTFMEDYNRRSPMQQMRTSWQDFNNVLADLATPVLPLVVGSLQKFDGWLKTIHETASAIGLGNPKPETKDAIFSAGAGALPGLVGGFFTIGALPGVAAGAGLGLGINDAMQGPKEGHGLFGAAEQALRLGNWLLNKDETKKATEDGTEKGSEKGSEVGTEKGTSKGIFSGLKSWLDSVTGGNKPIGLSDYGTGASSMSGNGATLASGMLGGRNAGSSPMGPLSFSSSGGSAVPGGAQRLMSDLIHKYGWSKEAAAVMAGNVQFESGFKTGSIGDGGTSFGLAQWHADRARRLMSEARGHGVDWRNWDLQLALMDREWRERYGDSVTSHDFNRLAGLGKRYEGYSTNTFGGRVGAASRYFSVYKDEDANVIPPSNKSHNIHVHNTTTLDGRILAKNTTKYITKFGQHPAAGARLPDYTGTRPYTIGGD